VRGSAPRPRGPCGTGPAGHRALSRTRSDRSRPDKTGLAFKTPRFYLYE
jgi:hypothetical protein